MLQLTKILTKQTKKTKGENIKINKFHANFTSKWIVTESPKQDHHLENLLLSKNTTHGKT